MSEDHRINEAEPLAQPRCDRKREGGEEIGPEEECAGRCQRHLETLEQPERYQRLDGEAASKSVKAEQGRELIDRSARRPERGHLRNCLRLGVRQTGIERTSYHPECSIDVEHRLHSADFGHPHRDQQVRQGGCQRASRDRQRTDQAVARENTGPFVVGDLLRERSLLERHVHADVAGRRVDGAEESDCGDQGEMLKTGKGDAGHNHQQRT